MNDFSADIEFFKFYKMTITSHHNHNMEIQTNNANQTDKSNNKVTVFSARYFVKENPHQYYFP